MDDQQRDGLADANEAPSIVGAVLDEHARSSGGLLDLDSAVRHELHALSELDNRGVELVRRAADAISYMITNTDSRLGFSPWMELADGTTVPVRIELQPDSTISDWKLLLENTTQPAWRSRFAHLIVASDRIAQGRERVALAETAIEEYLRLSRDWGSGLDAFDNLRAALALARQFRMRERIQEVLDAAVSSAEQELRSDDLRPGVILRLTNLLITHRVDSARVQALLQGAEVHLEGDVHNLDDIFSQHLRIAADGSRPQLWEIRVGLWLGAAEDSDGVVRASHLKRAVELATTSGVTSLRDVATRKLQEITLDDLQLQGLQTGLILRGEQIAAEVRPITAAPSWREALHAFAMMGPITGVYEKNLSSVRDQSQQFISHIIPRTTFGGDGLPRFTATSGEELEQYHLTSHETFILRMRCGVVTEGLLRIPKHHGYSTEEELAGHFAGNPIVPYPLALAIARSFLRWWQGDYEGAAFTAAPRVESLARNLLLALDAGIYRLQRQDSPGQYPGLGSLLGSLHEKGLSTDWFRFIHCVLTNPVGWNLRNELSHGLIDDVDPIIGALILQCVAHIALLRPSAGAPQQDAAATNSSPDPTLAVDDPAAAEASDQSAAN
jgi:hypothetical protein